MGSVRAPGRALHFWLFCIPLPVDPALETEGRWAVTIAVRSTHGRPEEEALTTRSPPVRPVPCPAIAARWRLPQADAHGPASRPALRGFGLGIPNAPSASLRYGQQVHSCHAGALGGEDGTQRGVAGAPSYVVGRSSVMDPGYRLHRLHRVGQHCESVFGEHVCL